MVGTILYLSVDGKLLLQINLFLCLLECPDCISCTAQVSSVISCQDDSDESRLVVGCLVNFCCPSREVKFHIVHLFEKFVLTILLTNKIFGSVDFFSLQRHCPCFP